MKRVPLYNYFKTKRERDFLLDLVDLNYVRPYVPTNSAHALEYYDITFIHEGKGPFTINEQTHIVGPNDVIFTRPGDVRNWDNKTIKEGVALVFDEPFLLTLFNDLALIHSLAFYSPMRYSVKLTVPEDSIFKIRLILSDLSSELQQQSKDKNRLRALLDDLLFILNRLYINENNVLPVMPEANKNVRNPHVNEFLKLVNSEYSREHSMRYYAERLDITPNYLNEIVKGSIGINAKQYILNRLTLEAKRMLAYTDHPIATIARTLYFDTASYFVRFFRRQTSYTPLKYRNMTRTFQVML
jgi:AraC-like DNA-binding protein